MSKITKKKQIEELQTIVAAQWRQINKLKLHLGRLVDIDWSDEQANHDEVIAILNNEQPKPKQLDQSVFDGLDEKWQWATVSSIGMPVVYSYKPAGNKARFSDSTTQEMISAGKVMRVDEYDYDATNWQNSLIERESKELTGSDLCRKMLERGDKHVMCKCWCSSYADIEQVVDIVSGFAFELGKKAFAGATHNWDYATPINNQGEPLTAADVGL